MSGKEPEIPSRGEKAAREEPPQAGRRAGRRIEAPPRDLRPGFKGRVIGILGAALIRLWGATLRIEWLGAANLGRIEEAGGRVCYTLWHGGLLTLAFTHRGRGVVVLVSRHGDGEIISQIICRLGYGVIRGSTTRGGLKGLLRMAEQGRRGSPLGVTPDGPRGPRRTLQPGVLLIAQRSGLPIVPIAIEAQRRWELASWDRFIIPWPWTRVAVATGTPIPIPSDLAPETLDRLWTPKVSAAMEEVQTQADSWREARRSRR